MKPNTRLRLEQGLFIVAILVVVGLLVRGVSRTEKLASAKGWAEQKAVIDYINSKEDLKPVAFVVAKQIIDISGDDQVLFKRVILLAKENKKDEIIQIINDM
jgi:glucose uptake protein GlcU